LAKKKSGTESLKKLVVDAILNKKGRDVVALDLRKINDAAADYFIITHGDSSTQVKAIFDSVVDEAGKKGIAPYHSEGGKNSEWIIVDFVDVVVHIFHRDKRDFYGLEDLWSDAKLTQYGDE
jgi:ribosome-associated protein